MNIYLIGINNRDKIEFKKRKVKKIEPRGFIASDGYCVSFDRINISSSFPYHIYFLDKKIAERCFLTIKNNAIKECQESIDFYQDKLKKFNRQKWKGKVE